MRDRGRLDLGWSDALAGYFQGVVAASLDVPVALVVDTCPIAVNPGVRESCPVRLEIAPVLGRLVAPEPAGHAGPGLTDDELADRAADRAALLVDDVGGHPRARTDERSRLDGRPRGAADDPTGDLGPARVVDDRATLLADVPEVPPPRIRVPGLSRRAQHEQR